jgi:mono/diheme cytochrome c family protein
MRSFEGRRLVHLVDYVAKDYPGAVRDGQIADKAEHEELRRLLTDATEAARGTPAEVRDELGRAVGALVTAFDDRRAAPDIEQLAAVVVAATRRRLDLGDVPSKRPDPARGAELYVTHCAVCHGEDGSADTPAAQRLTPRPAIFADPRVAETLSPFRVVTAVEMGIAGTAMVPLPLSESDRWDIAMHVSALARGALRTTAPPPSGFTLGEVTRSTDAELREALVTMPVRIDRVEEELMALRSPHAAAVLPQVSPLSSARDAVFRARLDMVAGNPSAARASIADASRLAQAAKAWHPAESASLRHAMEAAGATLEPGASRADVDRGLSLAVSLLRAMDQDHGGGFHLEAELAIPAALFVLIGIVLALRARQRKYRSSRGGDPAVTPDP